VIWQQFPGKFISINGQTISEGVRNREAKDRQQKAKLILTITMRIYGTEYVMFHYNWIFTSSEEIPEADWTRLNTHIYQLA
jgi:hypothetical protein